MSKHIFSSLRWCLVGLVTTITFTPSVGQSADKVLDTARRLYAAEKYDSTITVLGTYVKKHGTDPSMEKIVPLLAESLVRVGKYSNFGNLFNIYRKQYPRSDFMPRLFYLEGVVAAREQRYVDAVEAFSEALRAGAVPPVDSLALEGA
ncbi:MAG: tetratricopeptide repeat protein, partial [Chitinivibrionales bacterium]|nr:tetratricopeptide repeat protein [Chitinivibrionales bacterium]